MSEAGEGLLRPPLFRPEVLEERPFGDSLDFRLPTWRHSALLAAAGLALLLLFDSAADFSRTEYVRGVVAPATGVSRVVSPREGFVSSVEARQGERVRAGQPLVAIVSNGILPSGHSAPSERLATYRRQASMGRRSLQEEQLRVAAEREGIDSQVGQLNAEAASLTTQIALQEDRIRRNELRLANLSRLRESGYVSLVAVQTQEETILSLRQQLEDLRQRRTRASFEIERLRSSLAALGAQSRRTRLQSEATLEEFERGAVEAQADAGTIVASAISGRVSAIHVSPGQRVAPGEEIASVVGNGSALTVYLFVPATSIGLVRAGQPVALRYDSYPYQRFGVGRGIITQVASTAISGPGGDPRPGAPSGYRAKVSVLPGARHFELRPDMTLSAGIMVERRSLLDWLLAPLRERLRERRETSR